MASLAMVRPHVLLIVLCVSLPLSFAAYCCSEGGYGHDWILFEDLIESDNEPQAIFLNWYANYYEGYKICTAHGGSPADCDSLTERQLHQKYPPPVIESSDSEEESMADLIPPVYCLRIGDPVSFKLGVGQWSGEDNDISDARIVMVSGPNLDNGCASKYAIRYKSKKSHEPFKIAPIVPHTSVRYFLVPECLAAAKQNTIGFHSSGFLRGVQDDDYRTMETGCVVNGDGQAVHYPVHDHFARGAAFLLCTRYANPTLVQWDLDGWIAARETWAWVKRAFKVEYKRHWSLDSVVGDCHDSLERNSVALDEAVNCRDFVFDYKNIIQYMAKHQANPESWEPIYLRALHRFDPMDVKLLPRHDHSAAKGEVVPRSLVVQRNYERKHTCAAIPLDPAKASYLFRPPLRLRQAERRKRISLGEVSDDDEIEPEQCFVDARSKRADKTIGSENLVLGKTRAMRNSDTTRFTDKANTVKVELEAKVRDKYATFDTAKPVGLLVPDKYGRPPTLEQPELIEPESHDYSSSLRMSSQALGAMSTYSTYQALKASGYSAQQVESAAVWLEEKLGKLGTGLGFPLRFVAVLLNGALWVMTQTLLAQAKLSKFCPADATKEECICDVVEPMIDLVKEATGLSSAQRDEFEIESGALTLMFHGGMAGHASVVGAGGGGGIYVQFQWSPRWEFEVGAYAGTGTALILGTDAVSSGVDACFKAGVFFGRKDEMSAWTKGISIGANVWIGASVGIDFLFRRGFEDRVTGERRCDPIDYMTAFDGLGRRPELVDAMGNGFLRMLLMPVHPRCIRGAYVAIHAEVKTTPTGADFNINTGYGVGKKIAFLTVDSDGPRSQALNLVRELADATHGHEVLHRPADVLGRAPHHRNTSIDDDMVFMAERRQNERARGHRVGRSGSMAAIAPPTAIAAGRLTREQHQAVVDRMMRTVTEDRDVVVDEDVGLAYTPSGSEED